MNLAADARRFLRRRLSAGFILLLIWTGGCGALPDITGLKSGSTEVTYDPRPGSPAFRALRLEKTESVVILNIEGDDVRGSMEKIYRVMLDKGYAVRDSNETLLTMKRANLLGRKSTDPAYLKKAAATFNEQIAIAGSVELIQVEPTRVLVALHLVDLKNQKILWTVKASYVRRYFGSLNPYERAVIDSIEKSLSVLPRAKP